MTKLISINQEEVSKKIVRNMLDLTRNTGKKNHMLNACLAKCIFSGLARHPLICGLNAKP
jgi:hypothetical protein